ncbi:MAG TPA: T9SS type A sorting domain-containing protein [Flavobacteriales bacterium]|nr:T9SS type A sorting domain-containing protein [Flavobacteriales bacterium]
MCRTFLPIAAVLLASTVNAQLPNPGFEEWSTQTGMNEPLGWRTMNFMSFNGDLAVQGTPGAAGDSFIRLQVVTSHGGTISNSLIFTAGAVDDPTGFPYSQRPTRLEGSHRFMPQGGANASITVVFYRWDAEIGQRISVGGGSLFLTTEVADWSTFEVPLVYFDPLPPDTGYISMTCGMGGMPDQLGTQLDFDDLQFRGLSTDVAEHSGAYGIEVFPSPATDLLWWSDRPGTSPMQWRIIATNGQIASEGRNSSGMPIDVHSLAQGLYTLQIIDRSERVASIRFVKE